MFVTAHNSQKVQFIVYQIKCSDTFRNNHFIIDFDEAKYETSIHNAEQIEYKECQTCIQRLCQFDVGIMEANDFCCN